MSAPVGFDWDWARTTGGNLSRRGFLQGIQLLVILAAQLPTLLKGRKEVADGLRGTARLDGMEMTVPDTLLARTAEQRARESVSECLLEHSYRTYLFGKALAKYDRVRVDDELSFVAAMLMNIALEHPVPGRCFAVRSAEEAERLLTDLGESPERIQAVRDGIASHITPGVDAGSNVLAWLLSTGAALGLFGSRWQNCDPDWIAEVVAAHPRLNFKNVVIEDVRAEVAAVPDGRLALIYHAADWEGTVRSSPFAE